MKIDPIRGRLKSESAGKRKRARNEPGSSFRDALASAANGSNAELEEIFERIDISGRELAENPGLEQFKGYRDEIRKFINLFLEKSYDIKLTSEMTLSGRKRHIVLVKKIDEKLEQLYQLFLQQVLDVEQLITGIDEVRGMILDLYR